MTSEQKIKQYLIEHKTPVTAKQMAERFAITRSTASIALMTLVRKGVASIYTQVRKETYYVEHSDHRKRRAEDKQWAAARRAQRPTIQ